MKPTRPTRTPLVNSSIAVEAIGCEENAQATTGLTAASSYSQQSLAQIEFATISFAKTTKRIISSINGYYLLAFLFIKHRQIGRTFVLRDITT